MDDITAISEANRTLAATYLEQRERFLAALEADAESAPDEFEKYVSDRACGRISGEQVFPHQ